jgi:hypothetical protein
VRTAARSPASCATVSAAPADASEEGGEIADDVNTRESPGPDERFAAAVYVRRSAMGLRGELAVLEIIPEGEGRVTLSDVAGRELFSHPPAQLQVAIASRTTFRVQHGEERWWVSGASFRSSKELERVRQRIDRDDVILSVPELPETDERTYNPLISNLTAQQQAWRGLWIEALRQAGAHVEVKRRSPRRPGSVI